MAKLLAFLDTLEGSKIYYRLNHVRDALMVEVCVPGERWEVEFFESGAIEIERFVSTDVQDIADEELAQLIATYSE